MVNTGRKRKWHSLFLVGSIMLTASNLMAQETYTLEECVTQSLSNNLQIKNSQLDIDATELKIREAKGSFLPSVDLKGQYQYYIDVPVQYVSASLFGGPADQYTELSFFTTQTTKGGVQVSQLLYNQKVFIGLKAAKSVKNMSLLQLENTKEDLTYNVSAVYYNIQVLEQNLALLDSNIVNLEKTVKINKSLQENNILSISTYQRLVINLENLKNEKENLSLSCSKTYNLLKFLMGTSLSESIAIKPFKSELAAIIINDNTIDNTIENRTDIKLMTEQIQLAKIDEKAAKADYYPTLAGSFNYEYTGYNNKFSATNTINDTWVKGSYVGLQLSVPIFSGFSRYQKLKQKQIGVLKAENSFDLMKQSAQKEISDALKCYQSRKNSLDNTQRSLEMASNLFKNATVEYQNGLITITDLISAQSDLSAARNNYSNAMINLKLAEIELKKANGTLLSKS